MKNVKIISKNAIFWNLQQFASFGKKICAMVKANAYGHGTEEIVPLLREKVFCFGVVSAQEGQRVRALCKNKILVCAKTNDYATCKKNDLDVVVSSAKEILEAKRAALGKNLHLEIDCGMNRYGVKDEAELEEINGILRREKISLNSICAHFPCSEDFAKTQKNYEIFMKKREKIAQKCEICFGGGGISNFGFEFDILRVGVGLYGYGKIPAQKSDGRKVLSGVNFGKTGTCGKHDDECGKSEEAAHNVLNNGNVAAVKEKCAQGNKSTESHEGNKRNEGNENNEGEDEEGEKNGEEKAGSDWKASDRNAVAGNFGSASCKKLQPVMKICSYVCRVVFAKRGEFIGYGSDFCVEKDGFFAIVPVGYADGLRRGLSGKNCVKIRNKTFHGFGNICMDCFFVRVDETVREGDEVLVLWDAEELAEKLNTISYEILTGFSSFRGDTLVL